MVRAALVVPAVLIGSLTLAEPFAWPAAWFDAATEDARLGGPTQCRELGDRRTLTPFVSPGSGQRISPR